MEIIKEVMWVVVGFVYTVKLLAGRLVGRYYRPLVDNRPFCLNGRYS